MEPKYIATLLCILLLLILLGWRARRRVRQSRQRSDNRGAWNRDSLEFGAASGATQREREEEAADRGKILIHGLMMSVSSTIETLLNDVKGHNDNLDNHRTSLRKADSLADLKEIERLLVDEIESLRSSNDGYRSDLDSAHNKIKVQQKELAQLNAEAAVDFLTKIPNRRALDERLFEELARYKRYGNVFSMVMIDLDHFKQVNDNSGHLAGDRILRVVADLIGGGKRHTDFVARFGGEEFVLILPETRLEQALVVAEKARRNIELTPITYRGKLIKITISAGVSEVTDRDDAVAEIVARADAALYRAKAEGRNRVAANGADGKPVEVDRTLTGRGTDERD